MNMAAPPWLPCVVAMAFVLFPAGLSMAAKAHYHVVDVQSLLPSTASCSSSASSFSHKDMHGPNHATLKVVHPHSPCYGGSGEVNHEEILEADRNRVAAIQQQQGRGSPIAASAVEIPARVGWPLGISNYIVTAGFGTPTKDLYIIFDTGSDLTWIQCQPCQHCYPQQDPIFNPSQSSTYVNFTCASPACVELHPPSSSCPSPAAPCKYRGAYVDKSYTSGFYGSDTLTLSPADVIPAFRFGCGEDNQGLFGKAAGVMGLGRRPISIVSQTNSKYGGIFSYCLPANTSSTGFLNFGSKAYAGLVSAPMLTNPSAPTFYFLGLSSMRVGGKQLPDTAFSGTMTLIDSGTLISTLPPAAYSALKTEFDKGMSMYKKAPPLSFLDTCYNLTGNDTLKLPTIEWVFGGNSVKISPLGVLYIPRISQACLAFAANSHASDVAIIGNIQQRNLDVVYNLPNLTVGFRAGSC